VLITNEKSLNKKSYIAFSYHAANLSLKKFVFFSSPRTLTNLASKREGYMLQKDRSKAKNVLQVRLALLLG